MKFWRKEEDVGTGNTCDNNCKHYYISNPDERTRCFASKNGPKRGAPCADYEPRLSNEVRTETGAEIRKKTGAGVEYGG